MSTLLVKQVRLDQNIVDILVKDNRISRIAPKIDTVADTVVNGLGKLAVPAFYNTHSHVPMTLFRSMKDKVPLFDWLNNYIWPAEAKLNDERVYWASKLAYLEMIKSGTVFVNDMYAYPFPIIQAAEDMGMRLAVSMLYQDAGAPDFLASLSRNNQELHERILGKCYSPRIQATYAPHAIYTVKADKLRDTAEKAQADNFRLHIHVAETEQELNDCRAQHNGMTVVEYLDFLGVLSPLTLAAHSIWLTDHDIEILAARGVHLSNNPCSNFKLNSGHFRFKACSNAGCNVTIGTDGCASNDSLSMFDEMKTAVFNAISEQGDLTSCGAEDIYKAATVNGARAFGLDAGEIAVDKLADIVLIDLNTPQMLAEYDWRANLVYAADSSCVDTVICDGRILMQHREVPGEAEIYDRVRGIMKEMQ